MVTSRFSWQFLTPTIIVLFVLAVAPIFLTAGISLFQLKIADIGGSEFHGIRNYLFLLEDGRFRNSLFVMAVLIVVPVGLQTIAGFFLAIILQKKLFGLGWLRILFLLPAVIPP